MALPKTKEFDIICPAVGNVEVKEDRLSSRTGHYAFEIEDQEGLKSGVAATTAQEFVLVDDTHVYRIKTTALLFLIKECKERRMIQMGYTTKQGKRAWGYIIPVGKIQFSPYAEEMKRWFP